MAVSSGTLSDLRRNSQALGCRRSRSMAQPSAACSTKPALARVCHRGSASIRILCSEFERWQANPRVLEIESVRSVPHVPVSHAFVERLIGTVRREYLDWLFFWKATDLEGKLELFKTYYNSIRVHQGLSGDTPGEKTGGPPPLVARLEDYHWRIHCHGVFELPIAA